jgi:hypothetical protein
MQETPNVEAEAERRFFMMDVVYTAKQPIVVVAPSEEEARKTAETSVPPSVIDFKIENVQEKTAADIETLFQGMHEAAEQQSKGKLN